MDLIISIILVISISSYKLIKSPSVDLVETTIINENGEITETIVKENALEMGTNLMLRKEPRAYHKIIDEMGLS